MRNLLIVGAGGHGRVVADAAQLTGKWSKISFLDDQFPIDVGPIGEVVGKTDYASFLTDTYQDAVVAIGNNNARIKIINRLKQLGFKIPSIIHPRAYISDFANVGEGTVLFAQSVVNAGAKVGKGAIINTGSTVDHDCELEEGVHISPEVNLAGGVKIGRLSWLGIGATVIQQINIGSKVIIGAGSVVIDHVRDNTVVVGVPGKIIREKEEVI